MSKMELYTIENPQTPKETGHIERKLSDVENDKLVTLDKNEILKEAQHALVGNEALYIKFLRATLAKDESKDSRSLVEMENIFIAHLQYLSESEIDSVVRQFNTGFRRFISEYKGPISINAEQRTKIFENDRKHTSEIRGNIHAEGIKSVISFIQSRKKFLESNPTNQCKFYTENDLDDRYKIDLIECVFKGEESLEIDTLNLVQIKSKEPSPDDEEKILSAHRAWTTSSAMSFENFKHEYTDGIPDEVTIEELAKNAEEVEMILFDICSNPNGFNPDEFIKRLNLENLSNKQKAWLLSEYSALIKLHIEEALKKGVGIQTAEAEIILMAIDALESRVMAKAKLPKNLAHIHNINSIIAVGPRIIKQESLVTQSENPDHDRVIKYN